MKTSIVLISLFLLAVSTHAQSSNPPALGLLRLHSAPTATVPSVLASNKYSVDDLTPGTSGGTKTQKRGVDCLTLTSQQTWTRPLRGSGQQTSFVSFAGYASNGTVIRIGGAWIGVLTGPGASYLQLAVGQTGANGISWQPIGVSFPSDLYDTHSMAPLSVLTVRFNPTGATWDLFYGSKLVAEDLSFYVPSGQTNSPDFALTAGSAGAWITGLVMSDENPLYVDANNNSVADSFEQQQLGSLLSANASVESHRSLAQAWRAYVRVHSSPALVLPKILADRF